MFKHFLFYLFYLFIYLFFELWMCVMGKGLSKNFHSIEIWANLFLLDNLVLMSSQDECHGKRSRQNSHRLEAFFYVFSAARWEVYKVQLNLYSLQPNMVKLYWFSSVQFSRSDMSNSLWPHESQHARPPCPSPCPGVHSDSHPLSPWCHTAISSSVVPFSSCLQFFPASGSFPMSQFFTSGEEFQLQHQSFQWIFRTDFL